MTVLQNSKRICYITMSLNSCNSRSKVLHGLKKTHEVWEFFESWWMPHHVWALSHSFKDGVKLMYCCKYTHKGRFFKKNNLWTLYWFEWDLDSCLETSYSLLQQDFSIIFQLLFSMCMQVPVSCIGFWMGDTILEHLIWALLF